MEEQEIHTTKLQRRIKTLEADVIRKSDIATKAEQIAADLQEKLNKIEADSKTQSNQLSLVR